MSDLERYGTDATLEMIARSAHNQLATERPSFFGLESGVMPLARPRVVVSAALCDPPHTHTWPAGRTELGVACACGEAEWPEWAFFHGSEEGA